ncbi:serine hydrolase domain-containing protein [Streptomyces sp. TRM 70351]|uniref:serine hydrolase domain-containing protein n=1 Tax=Streptomyces sp. TRM 70351 TaxID=3116552 RepID=UPI002E7B831F|nr:serine hydrolase domain-containing protein [Streptomyces sp. TRM 70351]MEE1929367.1 serine hydrolase domain-containing protein [Streptomyces sp. TRM 70351]
MASRRTLLPRSAPAASGISSRSVAALLDRLEARSVECHSLMVVRRGHVVAEGWWAPYSAGRPHLLYSLTKSFTSVAVGLAVADGLLAPDDRVVDVLPDHVPAGLPEQGRRLTVHHLLSMTAGHRTDSLAEAWQREPGDLVKGFLRVPFPEPEGTRHAYDNPTTFVLARMVERVTGRGLAELLDERLFTPMGVDHAEWDRVASGAVFGFHGLHLTTEAVAAFGELLLRGGLWNGRRLVPREWVELATRRHIGTRQIDDWSKNPDALCGYGYQFWMSQHGYRGEGAYGQLCVVVPSHELVVAVTGAVPQAEAVLGPLWECLLPGLDQAGSTRDDEILAGRLRRLSLEPVPGSAAPERSATARLDASVADSALPEGTTVTVDPVDDGWLLRLGPSLTIEAGHGTWRESAPLGRPVVAAGAWQGDTFTADLYVITTPHRVRLSVDAGTGTATATWNVVPLTSPSLALHLRAPLMTRPDVA